ncbi:hypothetical protein [Reyranella sp.]|uniref:hypothetical protein n=1 Tax=Reyranella sp. TaxID=1929291 RepID=UPI003BACE8BC
MKANLAPSVSLDFLDGYLFRLLQEILADRGAEESGFFDYYSSRIKERIGGLMEYEERLARYLLAHFRDRHVVHAGTGIGTLPCALACSGMTVTAIENYRLRVASARRIRAAVVDTWPDVGPRYDIIEGLYPGAWRREGHEPNSILVFTNVASNWNPAQQAAILQSMPAFGVVILDLRLFGRVRDDDTERTGLFDSIAATAQSAERLPDIAGHLDAHFARFVFSDKV